MTELELIPPLELYTGEAELAAAKLAASKLVYPVCLYTLAKPLMPIAIPVIL